MKINLSENIKRLRRDKNLTQEALADFLGVTSQSVSHWERGESYPDITLLPEIAEFFNISVDCLLGINHDENENEISERLKEYDNIRNDISNESKKFEIISTLYKKYPVNFKVLLKYMEHIIAFNIIKEDKLKIKNKVMSIYNNIRNNCTVDSIRISAKKQYIHYCFQLTSINGSGITLDECKNLINELPEMKDCRELFCLSVDEIEQSVQKMIDVFFNSLSDYYLCSKFSREYQIECINKTIDFLNFIFDDGNYGTMWTFVINCCYGILGLLHYNMGDTEKALKSFEKSAVLACEFDRLDTITQLKSTLFSEKEFDKRILGVDFSAKEWIKDLFLNQYWLSDEFKSLPEFKKIVEMLG